MDLPGSSGREYLYHRAKKRVHAHTLRRSICADGMGMRACACAMHGPACVMCVVRIAVRWGGEQNSLGDDSAPAIGVRACAFSAPVTRRTNVCSAHNV